LAAEETPPPDNRGGAFCVVPGVLLPAGALEKAFYAAPIYNLDFDIGVSPDWSVIFGTAYADLPSKLNRDAHLLTVPAWFGFKSKAQFLPAVELFWDFAGELLYEKTYIGGKSGTGSVENLDGGLMLGAGFDLWLTKWLVTGVESKAHLIFEGGQIYPFVQLGLRIGVRG
jgi:hypothetical protein